MKPKRMITRTMTRMLSMVSKTIFLARLTSNNRTTVAATAVQAALDSGGMGSLASGGGGGTGGMASAFPSLLRMKFWIASMFPAVALAIEPVGSRRE